MNGDALARGAKSATFGPAKVSQKKWDKIWEDESPKSEVKDNTVMRVESIPSEK